MMVDAFDDYEDNSPQVMLRVALAVALGDALLVREEQDKLLQVYAEILDRLGDDGVGFGVEEDVDAIADRVAAELEQLEEPEDQAELFEEWAAAVTDPDLQEAALVSALRIAGAGLDSDAAELAAFKVFVESWALDLDEILAPFVRD